MTPPRGWRNSTSTMAWSRPAAATGEAVVEHAVGRSRAQAAESASAATSPQWVRQGWPRPRPRAWASMARLKALFGVALGATALMAAMLRRPPRRSRGPCREVQRKAEDSSCPSMRCGAPLCHHCRGRLMDRPIARPRAVPWAPCLRVLGMAPSLPWAPCHRLRRTSSNSSSSSALPLRHSRCSLALGLWRDPMQRSRTARLVLDLRRRCQLPPSPRRTICQTSTSPSSPSSLSSLISRSQLPTSQVGSAKLESSSSCSRWLTVQRGREALCR
mmetsp:Transcript_119161/g.254189  ORF Transcript_119161/g.254189 Transcript_119161/m.254189 type:complete len:273 (+) Transcript_119161:619-1437(+)